MQRSNIEEQILALLLQTQNRKMFPEHGVKPHTLNKEVQMPIQKKPYSVPDMKQELLDKFIPRMR